MNKVVLTLVVLGTIVFAGCVKKAPAPVEPQPMPEAGEVEVNTGTAEANTGSDQDLSGAVEVSINTGVSVVSWSGERIVGSAHAGTVAIKEGTAKLLDGKLVQGEAVIDMTTIVGDNDRLVEHLKNADFFDVATYPEAKIVIKSVTENEMGEQIATADLTIKNITNEVTFAITEEAGAMMMSFNIDRTLWDIKYDSGKFFADLGDKAIKDEIMFGVKIVLAE